MKPCRSCGAVIGADHPHGLCAACLMKRGLEAEALQCTKCQTVLDDDARFCSQCGSPAPAATSAQGDPIRAALEAKLLGHYRIVRLLGRGGMGAVYLARDLTLDREVAVKVVSTESKHREMYERFRREARTAAKLSHPNIVPLHAFGEVEGMPYFVMGYVRGESLAARLRRDGKLREEEARRILAEVADALDHAHRNGIVHRDIKPDNVLLDDETGRALLTDFGVAKAIDAADTATRSGSVLGTPHYMSPEQVSGHANIDGRSDIYSLGVMGYVMLTGHLPFEGGTVAELLTKQVTQQPQPVRTLASNVSDATAQAIERCLAKDPARRWPDARSLKIALGGDVESQLPDALQEVEGTGVIALAIVLATQIPTFFFPPPLPVYFIEAAMYVLPFVVVLLRMRREGFSFAQSHRAIWSEPRWWRWWYPRAYRRRGNVWDRLPVSVRRLRTVPLLLPIVVVAMFAGPFPNSFRHPVAFWTKVAMVFGWIALFDLALLRARLYLGRRGVVGAERRRMMLSERTSGTSFWSRPHIAAILTPPVKVSGDSPTDQLQMIVRSAGELSGVLRPLGAEAVAAARQLLASLDDIDREIADIAKNIEPGEEARLQDKIAALDDDGLKTLLQKQLELIRSLSARVDEAKAHRNRRIEQLKTLALHVASLRARSAESEVRAVSDRVRALCEEIAGQAQAVDHGNAATVAR